MSFVQHNSPISLVEIYRLNDLNINTVPEGVSVCMRGPEKIISLMVRDISQVQENRG